VSKASLNPFTVSGTDMPPNLLLMSKLVAVCFLVSGQWAALPRPFIPLVGVLDDLGSATTAEVVLKTSFLVAAALLLMNRSPRLASVALGIVIFVGMLASRNYIENNRFFVVLLFVLAGLSNRQVGGRLIQLQLVVLYFGAALNKLLDVDWRSGQYFEHLPATTELAGVYSRLTGLFPELLLSAVLAWAVIATEFALAAAFLLRRFVWIAVWLGVAYHTSLVLVTGRTFGMFWYAATASYFAFAQVPSRLQVTSSSRAESAWARLRRPLRSLDTEHQVSWSPPSGSRLAVASGTTTYFGFAALTRLAVGLPPVLFAVYIFAALPMLNHRAVAAVVMIVLIALAVSVTSSEIRRTREVGDNATTLTRLLGSLRRSSGVT
jgi:hypothetical protein